MPTVNIATHLKEMAERQPEQLAVRVPATRNRRGGTTYKSYSYQQLDEESDRLAAGLAWSGVGRGSRAVLMVPPSLEFFALTFALFKGGVVPVFVDPGMGLKNIGKCLLEAKPETFIGITKAHVARQLFGWGKRTVKTLVTVGPRLFWSGLNLNDIRWDDGREYVPAVASLVRQGADSLDVVEAVMEMEDEAVTKPATIAGTTADETAAILFTSGSTGVPKGAVYSHGNFAAQIEILRRTFHIEPGEVDLCTFPLFALFAPALGMTAIVPRMDFTRPAKVDPQEVSDPVREFQVANLFGSPALLNRVGRFYDEHQEKWPSLRRVLSAGAPVSSAIIERFSKRLESGVQIFTPYGATEALPVTVIGSDEILTETRHKTAQGAGTCVGRPVEGVQVAIIRISDGPILEWSDSLLLPPGEIGEIVVNGPNVTQEYFQRPDLTALAKIRDPVTGRMRHRMGDVGYFDEQGRLWFCGRKSHRVVTAERTYFTEPIEGVFNSHPHVFRTALVGVNRGARIEPVLCVEREIEARRESKDKLAKELLDLGAKHEHTRAIQTILYHDAFPVDIRHNSKIFREKLAVWAARRLR